MKNILRIFLVVFLLCQGGSVKASTEAWHNINGKHFIVYYEKSSDRTDAQVVLRSAEKYYKKIGSRIGYTRYKKFWTWDERVKILLFHDQRSFLENTGQPSWSVGYAARDMHLFKTKVIVTYKREHNFYNALLPHEISHLILHDFLTPHSVPVWFDEGVAQLPEKGKSEIANQTIKVLVSRGRHIPLEGFLRLNIRKDPNPNHATVFYAQGLSIVDFLIKKYGSSAFRELCRNMRDGKSFEMALKNATSNRVGTIADLEKQWIAHVLERY